jgi:hypothetical protein
LLSSDFNKDSNLDLVVANACDNNLGVLLVNGDGTFQNQKTYRTGKAPTFFVIGDFNNDAKLDLAVIGNGSSNVRIFYNSYS